MTTLRSQATAATFWTAAVVTAVLVLGGFFEGDWQAGAAALAPGALIVWGCWVLLYRPMVRFDDDCVVAVNLGRVVEIPWRRVTAVRQRYQLVFDLDDGSHVACWGGPMSAKPVSPRRRGSAATSSATIAATLESVRASAAQRATDAAPPVVRRWDLLALAIGAALVVVVALQLTL